uniref:Uncharacterized protein n=1 Tax=Coccolithus braarudii TaxID=221442 RepID=A0A7S0LLD4_9EUKA
MPAHSTMRRVDSSILRRRCHPPLAKTTEFSFAKADDHVTFGCKQRSISVVRPEPRGSLHEFVTNNAEAIVLSSWRPGQVRREDDGSFSINVEEFEFLAIKVAVTLRARVWLDERTSTAHFESCGFVISGLETIARTDGFDISVRGSMRPSPPKSALCALTGNIEFTASGDVPRLVRNTPEAALRAATKIISTSLINAASERFDDKVPAAYRRWAAAIP